LIIGYQSMAAKRRQLAFFIPCGPAGIASLFCHSRFRLPGFGLPSWISDLPIFCSGK